jgi:HK97 family phage portal protein
MLETLRNFFRKESSTLRNPQPWLREALGSTETHAGVNVTAEGSLAVSSVCACVRLLSESVASLPLFVYRRTETSKIKAPDYPAYWVLHDQPNDYQTSFTWRAQAMNHVLLHGNAYSVIERDTAGIVKRLWPLAPETVTVKTDGGEIAYTYYRNGQKQTFGYSDILHLKGPTLNGIIGLSVVGLAKQGIGLATAQDQHGASMFKNRARPGVLLKIPGKLTPNQRKDLLEGFEDKFSGALNHGKTFLLEGGMELAGTVGFSAEDAQFLQSRQFSVQEIARWFRVSPTMIGDLSRSTYSNSEQEQLSFLQHSLRPWLVNFESEINLKLFPSRTQFFAEFDMAALQRADQATRYEAYSKGLAAGFLTVSDVRSWENLPELPGTNQLMRPANMLPASEATNGQ